MRFRQFFRGTLGARFLADRRHLLRLGTKDPPLQRWHRGERARLPALEGVLEEAGTNVLDVARARRRLRFDQAVTIASEKPSWPLLPTVCSAVAVRRGWS